MPVKQNERWMKRHRIGRALYGVIVLGLSTGLVGCMSSYFVLKDGESGSSSTQSMDTNAKGSATASDSSKTSSSQKNSTSGSTKSVTTSTKGTTTTFPSLGPCPGKKIRCGLLCVDVRHSKEHCGGCFVGCPNPGQCVSGQCLRTCDLGCESFEECNSDNYCGCKDGSTHCGAQCVDMGRDREHCGACGVVCGAQETCIAGRCQPS